MNQQDFVDLIDTPAIDLENSLLQNEQLIDNPEELDHLYHQFQMEEDNDYNFYQIVDHYMDTGNLFLKVNCISDDKKTHTLEILFQIIKKDIPLELAKYIQEKVLDEKKREKYNTWVLTTIKSHNRSIRRHYKLYNVQIVNKFRRVTLNRQNNISRNHRNLKQKHREKME